MKRNKDSTIIILEQTSASWLASQRWSVPRVPTSFRLCNLSSRTWVRTRASNVWSSSSPATTTRLSSTGRSSNFRSSSDKSSTTGCSNSSFRIRTFIPTVPHFGKVLIHLVIFRKNTGETTFHSQFEPNDRDIMRL